MKKTIIVCFALLSGLLVAAQSAENRQQRDLSNFSGISVSNGIELLIRQGADAVSVSASTTEYRNKIKTEVVDGILKIYYDNGNVFKALDRKKKQLKAYVSIATLNSLVGHSGGSISFDGEIATGTLTINLAEGSSLKGNFKSNMLNITLSSGAVATLTGTSASITVKSSSGAHFRGYDVKVQNCNASASSAAKIEITVSKELAATASSGGKVQYKGSAVIKNVSISSGGKINKA